MSFIGKKYIYSVTARYFLYIVSTSVCDISIINKHINACVFGLQLSRHVI